MHGAKPVPLAFRWYHGAFGSLLSGGVVALNAWFISSMPTAHPTTFNAHEAQQ